MGTFYGINFICDASYVFCTSDVWGICGSQGLPLSIIDGLITNAGWGSGTNNFCYLSFLPGSILSTYSFSAVIDWTFVGGVGDQKLFSATGQAFGTFNSKATIASCRTVYLVSDQVLVSCYSATATPPWPSDFAYYQESEVASYISGAYYRRSYTSPRSSLHKLSSRHRHLSQKQIQGEDALWLDCGTVPGTTVALLESLGGFPQTLRSSSPKYCILIQSNCQGSVLYLVCVLVLSKQGTLFFQCLPLLV